MIITIGNRTKEEMKVLGLKEYPFTVKELSDSFRNLIKEHHPDKNNGNPESEEISKKIINAYSWLKNLAMKPVTDEQREEAIKIFEEDEDLFSLWENCPDCGGKGYNIRKWDDNCPDCNPNLFSMERLFHPRKNTYLGKKRVKCRECHHGIFLLRNGREVTCRRCNGLTFFFITCFKCKGTGFLSQTEEQIRCFTCHGKGKIKLNPFNPVIRKGSVLI